MILVRPRCARERQVYKRLAELSHDRPTSLLADLGFYEDGILLEYAGQGPLTTHLGKEKSPPSDKSPGLGTQAAQALVF